MSTVYSGEVAVGSWNRIRIKCDYSGTSASLTIQFRRTSSYSTTWSSSSATLTFNGQTKSAAYSYTGTVGTNWVDLRAAISGYTISASGGTYNWSFVDNAVLGCSGTITIPAQGSAPSNGNISNLTVEYNGSELEFASTSVSVNDGGLALDINRFEICDVPLTGSGIAAQIKNFTIGQPITLTQSDSTAYHGGITIVGNHLYYSGLCARNSAGLYYYNGPSIVTPCEPASISISKLNDTSINVSYSTVADGGFYTKTIEYSLDGGVTWITGATISTSSAASSTFTVNSLNSGDDYVITFRVSTPAGYTHCGSFQFVLTGYKLYGSVSDISEKIKKLYGLPTAYEEINYIDEIIDSINPSTFAQYLAAYSPIKTQAELLDIFENYPIIKFENVSSGTYAGMNLYILDKDGNSGIGSDHYIFPDEMTFELAMGYAFIYTAMGTPTDLVDYMFYAVPQDTVASMYQFATNPTSKSIVKLYGSVNGRAKLIYKEFQ